MINIKEIHSKYMSIEMGDLSDNLKNEMYKILSTVRQEDLRTMEEHKMYVEVLHRFRKASMASVELFGKNFKKTLDSLLMVGEDGVYSNNQRFIYELIQNVDDCEYESVDNCKLEIQFCWNTNPGRIILYYNEKGFRPENVFAITGIAEASKNISADKIEIGEKGIGFKSVFGIADKVHIESGMFSFELYKDNFIIPIPRYDSGFQSIDGTRLTLEMNPIETEKIYRSIAEQYVRSNDLMNKNPILFMNKLTHIKMYFDSSRYIKFDIQRGVRQNINGLLFEKDVEVSVDMKECNKSDKKSKIVCVRYTMPIIYGRKECVSRYTEETTFNEKKHNLIAVFPILDENLSSFEGILYSFLPTQIKIQAPLVLHVPYKLDGSREFVDPQKENAWFNYTTDKLSEFLKKIYLHFATVIKQEIVNYIPKKSKYFFIKDNEKIECLWKNSLCSSILYQEKLFLTQDGYFESANNIISFAPNEEIEDKELIYGLLGCKKKLFIPSGRANMNDFGGDTIVNVYQLLFKRGIETEDIFEEIAKLLEKQKNIDIYEEICKQESDIRLSAKQILVISNNKKLYAGFDKYVKTNISNRQDTGVVIDESLQRINKDMIDKIIELTNSADLKPEFERYLQSIEYRLYSIDCVKDNFYLAGKNGIVLSKTTPLSSFGDLAEAFDPRKTFSATLQIRQASEKLNTVDDSMSNHEYLKLLRSVRSSLINAFGEKMYSSYIQIINQSGSDKNRFLNELLQNADDCLYAEGAKPTFILNQTGDKLTVLYNESGFTKDNVRAITSIGESTKKMLLSGENNSIGEKGVGFKSIFGVASSVDIHSNGFHFRLTDKKPTVPDKCESNNDLPGTTMEFQMKEDISELLTVDRILQLCLCLRNIRNIEIHKIRIRIDDSDNERVIEINGITYRFEKVVLNFSINDEEAIKERSVNQKVISNEQRIVCYLPKENNLQILYLYAGLPTIIETKIPLIIDAPFEMTTSRDTILQSRWNNIIKNYVYKAILKVMEVKREVLLIDVFKNVNFVNQNNAYSYKTFEDRYLNNFEWEEHLKALKVLPVLNENRFVTVADTNCVLVPDVIFYIAEKKDVSQYFRGTIIDTKSKSQYLGLLKHIGCKEVGLDEVIRCIEINIGNMVENEKYRKALFTFLANNQQSFQSKGLDINIRNLPIYPIRTASGTEYIQYNANIYTHENEKSNNEYYILDTNIMDYEMSQKILGANFRFNQMTQDVYDATYRKSIENIIKSNREAEYIAKYLLREFKQNRNNFSKCKSTLKGMISEIPMLMENGLYKKGNKYLNKADLFLVGELVLALMVSEKYKILAEFLECTDIVEIHYEDIDIEITRVSDDEIEDIQNYFKNNVEIITGLLTDGCISDEQIEKLNLQYYQTTIRDGIDDIDEEFPGRKVKNLEYLKRHIQEQWKNHPNPYVQRKYVKREPEYTINKEAYTASMYQSELNENKCFCQMCRRLVNEKYIERNVIQKEPVFAWKQMYLSLCLNCSKDYILLRNNIVIWKRFVVDIQCTEVKELDKVEIKMADRSITFTATHLAEIQEIMQAERQNSQNYISQLETASTSELL